jgi:glycosyltransferase involved in cell wall biosynthesis
MPDRRRASQYAKEKLGFAHHRIILTFGLISPNKGIETMIEAMPVVLAMAPDALYVVMGATHPALCARRERPIGKPAREGHGIRS